MPKGIMMSQGHMRASAQMFGVLTKMSADDVLYSCFPLHHVLASITGVLATLEAGCTMSLASRFSASQFWKHIRDCGATVAHNLDPVVSILMKRAPDSVEDANNVRCMYTAAGSYPEFEERFGTRLIPLFDMSELTVIAHYRPGQERRPGSCGQESDLFTVAIVDERDCLVDPGKVGQIAVRPKMPNVMYLGYYGDEGKTVEQWQNLWFHTGDMGFLDDDGFLHFTGRSADRIRRRGVNVSAEQIEALVLERPEISECAAIAVPSDVSEDEIKVCVSLIPGAQVGVEELGEWVAKVLPDQLCPRYIEVYSSLPRTDTAKIRKSVLRAEGDHGISVQTWDIGRRVYLDVPSQGHREAQKNRTS
jgi:crotonobetaine/carnitine-CoA ligase